MNEPIVTLPKIVHRKNWLETIRNYVSGNQLTPQEAEDLTNKISTIMCLHTINAKNMNYLPIEIMYEIIYEIKKLHYNIKVTGKYEPITYSI